ncbi:hypothetical protein FOS14_23495 [Skermania sp. ID1734]|uniref:C40 family peptidase n=1 Tax=Skermania sp. ID1734 TaxID=2597516 RepID=UPI00117DC83D|nr:bifunctional lytic transglycosylase/C40 family peptidase [Skermania sp. ID1734]TSD93265.1 hypothetical protein FOS14_23495 [Skermania sp. ID1734]
MSAAKLLAGLPLVTLAGLALMMLGSRSLQQPGLACPAAAGIGLAAAVNPPDPAAATAGCAAVPGATGLNLAALLHDYPAAAAFVPWILKFAGRCRETTAPIIAAQIRNESGGFQVQVTNPSSGAQGPTQFLPSTWATHGIDGDGDGKADPFDIADAVASQVKYDCDLAELAHKDLASGGVHGDPSQLMLSYYNCGPAASKAAGGICGNSETRAYVTDIPHWALAWSVPAAPLGVGGPAGEAILTAARRELGLPYAWGGGNQFGPTLGHGDGGGAATMAGDANKVGFDCSGLVQYAVYQGTGGGVLLPHFTVDQLNSPLLEPVPLDQAAPGDLMFPAGSSPQHVVLYLGGGQIIQAPESGQFIDIVPMAAAVGDHPSVRRVK